MAVNTILQQFFNKQEKQLLTWSSTAILLTEPALSDAQIVVDVRITTVSMHILTFSDG